METMIKMLFQLILCLFFISCSCREEDKDKKVNDANVLRLKDESFLGVKLKGKSINFLFNRFKQNGLVLEKGLAENDGLGEVFLKLILNANEVAYLTFNEKGKIKTLQLRNATVDAYDEFGVKVGMLYDKVLINRPNLIVYNNYNQKTFLYDTLSSISYEISATNLLITSKDARTNYNGIDSVSLRSMEVKRIIWGNGNVFH